MDVKSNMKLNDGHLLQDSDLKLLVFIFFNLINVKPDCRPAGMKVKKAFS